MASSRASPTLSTLLLLLATSVSAMNLPLADRLAAQFRAPTPTKAAVSDVCITEAPSADALDLRLRVRGKLDSRATGLQTCATACIASVVTKSTLCSLGDYDCECESSNTEIIEAEAYGCVMQACGVYVAAAVWSEAADLCSSVLAGDLSATGASDASTTLVTPSSGEGSVVVVTETAGDGLLTTSTVFVSNPTGSSSESSGEYSSSGSSSSGSSHKSSLSTGSIVGIAVGSAGGAILLCAVLFLIYKFCLRKQPAYNAISPTDVRETAANTLSGPHPGVAPAVVVPGQPELDGKPSVQPVTTAIIPSAPTESAVLRHPSVISNLSSQPHHGVPVSPTGQTPLSPPGASELYAQAWHQPPPQQYITAQTSSPGYTAPEQHHIVQPGTPRYEMQGPPPPELQGNAQFVQELHGQVYSQGVYEMPSSRMN
ncbi:hypothetical protein NKR23_g2944 [Pleurostoma richardsiae]|uniref:CFEM domain-containing protein n=1 Tax=Pleurostoma richardsiae TaxID=41990 RepID=A0AA38VUS8_9PEZI|nr:hypothetical protein NKR23_g2944 [Pleurostoma richardsiae]